MADGFKLLGNAFGGDSEESYQEGRLMGAKTEAAFAEARERVNKNAARQQSEQTFIAAGVEPARAKMLANAAMGDIDLGQLFGGALKQQEIGLRDRASDPNLSFSDRNIALQGVASAPVDRYQKISGRAVDDRFDEAGVQNLGDAFGGGENESAQMQLIREIERRERAARGDPNFTLSPRQTMGIAREGLHNVDVGGVPATIDFLDSLGLTGGAPLPAPRPATAPGSAAPAAPAAAPPRVAPTAAPAANVDTVVDNTRRVAAGKEQGQAQGRNAAGLESTLNSIDDFDTAIQGFLQQPGYKGLYGNIQGTEAGKLISGVLSEEISNARAAHETLGGKAFLASIQKMRGFGQLSNQEGAKVQTALTRALDTRIGENESIKAWAEVRQHLAELKRVARIEAAQNPGAGGGAGPAIGTVEDGFQFIGGDPANPASWQPVQ